MSATGFCGGFGPPWWVVVPFWETFSYTRSRRELSQKPTTPTTTHHAGGSMGPEAVTGKPEPEQVTDPSPDYLRLLLAALGARTELRYLAAMVGGEHGAAIEQVGQRLSAAVENRGAAGHSDTLAHRETAGGVAVSPERATGNCGATAEVN
jgi:hypothetical protein